MKQEYKKILNLLEQKIDFLDSQRKNDSIVAEIYMAEREKFCKLYKLISNEYQNFFSEVDMEIAIAILQDIGIDKQEVMNVYQNLIKEDIEQCYVLIDDIDEIEKTNI